MAEPTPGGHGYLSDDGRLDLFADSQELREIPALPLLPPVGGPAATAVSPAVAEVAFVADFFTQRIFLGARFDSLQQLVDLAKRAGEKGGFGVRKTWSNRDNRGSLLCSSQGTGTSARSVRCDCSWCVCCCFEYAFSYALRKINFGSPPEFEGSVEIRPR